MGVGINERRPKKRERTQLQLIEAAIRVFAEKGVGGAPIQAIAAEAGLANGTFYNHFASKQELVGAVAGHLVDRMSDQIAASSRGLEDPAEWVSVALRRFHEKARLDPIWGNVTVRLGASASDASRRIAANMTRDLEEGIRRGRFRVYTRQAAADLVLGAGLMSILSASTGRAVCEHGSHIAAMTLRGLGLDADEAHEIAHRTLPPIPED
jgi:AcrR family transcriptional regulator